MWSAAFRGELYRAVRNLRILLIAYGTSPLLYFFFGTLFEFTAWYAGGPSSDVSGIRLALRPFGQVANPIAVMLFAIGAASLVADDYRWETWRLAATRNDRAPLIVSKFMLYGMFSAGSLMLSVIGYRAVAWMSGLGQGSAWPGADALLHFGVAFLGSWLELCVAGAITFGASLWTRSALGGIFPTFLFALGSELTLSYLHLPLRATPLLLLPAHAGDVVRQWAAMDRDLPIDPATAALALLALTGWVVAGLTLAVAIFVSQDLSNE